MEAFKSDQQIHERPTCANKKCNNTALILVANRFICGNCLVKLNKKRDKMITEMMDCGC